jgi:hypothetical protein
MQQFLYWWVQVLLLCGGHQKVIGVVGGGTELLLNNRRAESGSLQLEIVSPAWSLSGAPLTGGIMGKSSGRLELTDSRRTGIKDLRFRTGTLRTCAFEHALPADQHSTP